jgi:aminoglycoside 6'-N-acetyltransferase I
MKIALADTAYLDDWAEMRAALWPELSGSPVGFAEASLRHDFVNGCETSPVLFLEGICATGCA